MTITGKIAVIMLAHSDYESMELSLYCHMAYGKKDVPFFILQNGRGTYDTERTLAAARRYEALYPETIRVIDSLQPDAPYFAILRALETDLLAPYDYICKLDDDVFPIAPGWLEGLIAAQNEGRSRYGDTIVGVTPLINNNCWGFPEVLKLAKLEERYFAEIARTHRIGSGAADYPYRLLGPTEIETGGFGTIWGCPHIARWLHRETSLKPDRFVAACEGQGLKLIPSDKRYSIGCLLFQKDLWSAMSNGSRDDEGMLHHFCQEEHRSILCQMAVPFVHLSYFSQREENRDVVAECQEFYSERIGASFPLSMKPTKLLDFEGRFRFLEARLDEVVRRTAQIESLAEVAEFLEFVATQAHADPQREGGVAESVSGAWKWFTGDAVLISPDGNVQAHNDHGTIAWDESRGLWVLRWAVKEIIDYLATARRGFALEGHNQYGDPVSAQRNLARGTSQSV